MANRYSVDVCYVHRRNTSDRGNHNHVQITCACRILNSFRCHLLTSSGRIGIKCFCLATEREFLRTASGQWRTRAAIRESTIHLPTAEDNQQIRKIIADVVTQLTESLQLEIITHNHDHWCESVTVCCCVPPEWFWTTNIVFPWSLTPCTMMKWRNAVVSHRSSSRMSRWHDALTTTIAVFINVDATRNCWVEKSW